jgi:hypothetical protein
MKIGPVLPDNILRLMAAQDRAALGKSGRTAAESFALAEAKTESELQEQICSMLRRREIVFIQPAMFKRSSLPVGWPDFTFAYCGVPVAWECKSARGLLSEEQLCMHPQMTACGWQVSVIRELREAIEILNNIGSQNQTKESEDEKEA